MEQGKEKYVKKRPIDRFEAVGRLYDFYGSLLTEKQAMVMEMYFEENLSLAEIGEEMGATKQAASILIKRTEEKLQNFEDKLGLVKKFNQTRAKIEKLVVTVDTAASHRQNDEARDGLLTIKRKIEELLDDI